MTDAYNTSSSDLWNEEYQKAGIPSSARDVPSNVVVTFLSDLAALGHQPLSAIDIGCGTGRNSRYLAAHGMRVFAMDYVESQIARFKNMIEAQNLPVEAVLHDVSTPWPIESDWADIAIDTYCFKHQIGREAISNYSDELRRTLKQGGDYKTGRYDCFGDRES